MKTVKHVVLMQLLLGLLPISSVLAAPLNDASVRRAMDDGRMQSLPDLRLPLNQALKVASLRSRTRTELLLLRESIAAQRGKTFKEPWIKAYFESRSWYHPGDFRENTLSEVDLANIGIIRVNEARLQQEDTDAEEQILTRGSCNHHIANKWQQILLFKKRHRLVVKGKRLPQQKKKSLWRVYEGRLEYYDTKSGWCEIEFYSNSSLGENLCRTCRTPRY